MILHDLPTLKDANATHVSYMIKLSTSRIVRNVIVAAIASIALLHLTACIGATSMSKNYDHRIEQSRWDPPARFNYPYKGELVLKQVAPGRVAQECLAIGITPQTDKPRGCANFVNGVAHIVTIDRPIYGTTPEAVFTHEQGHINGWSFDHPD